LRLHRFPLSRLSTALLAASTLVSGMSIAPQAFAQSGAAAQQGIETIVVTAGRREQPISDVLASVQVVSTADILTFSGASLTEVLRQSTGVDARTSGANSTVAVRGQIPNAGSAVLFLFDGMPRTGKFGSVNLNNFPVEDVEQVEIIRGPMSALYGANASGGVINVITKAAGEGAPLTVGLNTGRAVTDEGDGRETLGLTASSNFKTGNVGHRLSLDSRTADPFRFDTTVGVDDLSALEHVSLTYAGALETSSAGRLRWTLENHAQDDRADGRTTTGTAFERFEKEDRQYGSVGYDVALGGGTLALEASYGVSDAKVNRSFPGPDETTDYDQRLVQGRYLRSLGAHNLLVGAGSQEDEVDVSILTAVGKDTNRFAFLQDEWDISDDIKLVAGVRMDDFDAFGKHSVPRLSIGSRGDGLTWRAGYGEAFRAPSVLEQYSRFVRGRFLIQGSPTIQPEETETWEAALGWRSSNTTIEAVFHDSDITNLIQAAANGQVSNRLIVMTYQNIQEAEISGVEVTGSHVLGAGFTLDAALEYLDAVDGITGVRLNGRAERTYKLGLQWEHGPLSMTLRGRHLKDIWGINPANRALPAFASDYSVADLQGRYAVSERLSLSVGLENMFDELTPGNWSSTGQIEDPAGRYAYVALRYGVGQ
jgi:outer membrane receptor for ferrienterochelin and colicins